MMRLGVNELKAELRKRGRSIGGKKAELQVPVGIRGIDGELICVVQAVL